jgi:hypothetical protein
VIGAPARPASPAEPASRPKPLAERLERLWSPRLGWALVAVGVLGVLLLFLARRTYPNYDTYYTLVWGQQLAAGHLPDYAVFRAPTPHPLATLAGFLAAPFGTASDRFLVLASLLILVALLVVLFRFTQRLLGTLVAVVALVVMLTRTDLHLLALRATFDLPFYALVFGAAALELRRPRAGWPVLVLLGLAGLLRPEAWLLAGVYWLWLVPATPRRTLAWLALLVAAPPLLWLLADLIVTGDPLYSLTSTREVAGQFGRQRGVAAAVRLIPDYAAGNDKVVTVGVGGLGLLLALYLLRRRAALAVALGGLGVATFLAIAAAGLSVIPRYLAIPSILLSLCVAVALTGWTLTSEPRARTAAIAVAVVSVLMIGWRAPAYLHDFHVLNGQSQFVAQQNQRLQDALNDPQVVAALERCRPITTPTHSIIPILRYETGLPKDALQASIAQVQPPIGGLLFVGKDFNFDPRPNRSTAGVSRGSARKPWSNHRLPGYTRIARNPRWRVFAACPGAAW